VGNYVMLKDEQGNGFLLDREDYEWAREPEEMKKWVRVTRPSSARSELRWDPPRQNRSFYFRPAQHGSTNSRRE
jgi:hypothetical protein